MKLSQEIAQFVMGEVSDPIYLLKFNDWLTAIHDLEKRVETLEKEKLYWKEVEAKLLKRIAGLEERLNWEIERGFNESVRADASETKLAAVREEADIGSYTEATRVRILNIIAG